LQVPASVSQDELQQSEFCAQAWVVRLQQRFDAPPSTALQLPLQQSAVAPQVLPLG
jgi:hypothetical protein